MSVRQGPWSVPVAQVIDARNWSVRQDDGSLVVWCRNSGPQTAPVALAPIIDDLPNRPPNRDRITFALNSCDLFGPEVDEALGVATIHDTVVDSWEAGTAFPTHDEVRRLATLTGYIPGWFYLGTLRPIGRTFYCGGPDGCVIVDRVADDPPAAPTSEDETR